MRKRIEQFDQFDYFLIGCLVALAASLVLMVVNT